MSECDWETRGELMTRSVTKSAVRLTAVLVVLNVEFCQEACRPDGDERRAIRMSPEEGRELFEGVLGEVVGDDN